MTASITVSGLIATTPRHLVTVDGLAITSFRMADSRRSYSIAKNEWIENTDWYTVTAYRQLAVNAAQSLNKGDRITVTGNVYVRDWHGQDQTVTSVEIEAKSIGHDLAWGTSVFTRTILVRDTTEQAEPIPADPARYEY
jgi:single-strand DNA-binding protein